VTFIWLGAVLIVVGVVLTAVPPIWLGRLSRLRRIDARRPSNTLEPERPGKGFDPRTNWPGLALIGLGVVLMIAGAAF
jgi:hypothetical protein